MTFLHDYGLLLKVEKADESDDGDDGDDDYSGRHPSRIVFVLLGIALSA